MRLNILAIGKMKKGPESDLLSRFVDRAVKSGKQLGISGPLIREWSESRADQDIKRKNEEADMLLSGAKSGGLLIGLDEHGKDIGSQEFSEILRQSLDRSVPEISIAIGGPDGHGQALLDNADKVLRFGKMTWPHQMVRFMLSEQLYRSVTILSGHPYHRV